MPNLRDRLRRRKSSAPGGLQQEAAPESRGEMQQSEAAKEQTEPTGAVLKRVLLKLAGYTALIILVLSFVIGVRRIPDDDMYPSFADGDLVVTYKLGGYYTGDVVFYKAEGKIRCGRITAVAGDEILIMDDGYYSINGSIPYERIYYPTKPGEELTYPYKVEQDKVFIMGDMRMQATDSRTYGAIPTKDIKGKVVLLLFRGRGF